MTNKDLKAVYAYFDTFIRNSPGTFPPRSDVFVPGWDTLMALVKAIEEIYPGTEFHFHRNYFRIECDGETLMQDKGSELKEAVVNCCFRFLSERDENAPKVEMLSDDFLMEDSDVETKLVIEKRTLGQLWNGYCPESWLQGKKVRMRLNNYDFYESEATGLQIAVFPGVQAIILKFRGEGKFRSTAQYGDEIENGELLSPQNIDRPPFNEPTTIFEGSENIEDYITRLIS